MPDEGRQRRKNLALLCVLLGVAVLFFCITIVKISHGGPVAG